MTLSTALTLTALPAPESLPLPPAVTEQLAAGRAVLILPDGVDPQLGTLEVALQLLGIDRGGAGVVVIADGAAL